MLTPEAREKIAAYENRYERGLQRALHDSAYTIGDHRLAEPGCEIWQKLPEGSDMEPRGGIVVEISSLSQPDDETGEYVTRRAYRIYDDRPGLPIHHRLSTLQEADVAGFDPPNQSRIRAAYRYICRLVGARRGAAHAYELDLVSTAARLAAIVGQRWA